MFWQGGLRCGSNLKGGGGFLGAGQVKKGVFTAAHTYTEPYMSVPPPVLGPSPYI